MRYLSVILWLLLGLLYYWIWSSNKADCCTNAMEKTPTEIIAPVDNTAKLREEELARKRAEEKKTAELAASESAIAEAEKSKKVTSVKTTDDSGTEKLIFYFPYNSANASYSSGTESDIIDVISAAKKKNKKVVVTGHTDDRGDPASNMKLGRWRAYEVKKKFISKGLSAGEILVRSRGEEQPVATNSTSAGRQKNRRVEIILQ